MSDEPRDNSGPAFPFTPNEQMKLPDGAWDQNTEFGDPGMSLRMYLAGEALKHPRTHLSVGADPDYIALAAFEIADALLRYERNSGVEAKP